MSVKKRRRLLSVLLIMAVAFTMLYVNCDMANAVTAKGRVKEIKFVFPSEITYEENTNGQWSLDSNNNFYYRYNISGKEPETFTAVYENGEEVTYSMKSGIGTAYYSRCEYEGDDGTIVTLYSPIRDSQEEKHFTVGGDNYFTFQFDGTIVKLPVKIIESTEEKTVDSISFDPVTPIQCDYMDSYTVYNGELDQDQLYFEKEDPSSNFEVKYFREGDKLSVTKGNITKEYTYKKGGPVESWPDLWTESKFIAEDGSEISPESINVFDDQDLEGHEWGVGQNCYIVLEYGGAVTKVPVMVKENEVASISVFVNEDSEEVGIACDAQEFGTDGNNEMFIDGIIAHKVDGSKETVKYKTQDSEGGGFFDEEGNEVTVQIRHQKNNSIGQWFAYYHGVSCPIKTIHNNTKWKIKEKPTCIQKGIYEKVCICGEVVDTKEIAIDPTAHSFTKYVYNNDAKVGVDGTETAVCDYGCGMTNTRIKEGSALDDPGSGGGIIIPPTMQKPVIATDDHSSATLSADGTKVTIKIEEGYELVSVILNGEDLGKVTTISGLKTGDRVSVTTRKTPTDEEEIQQELKGVNWKNFLTRSAQVKMKNGKKAIRLTFINNHDISFDGIEVFRSLKKNSGYGTEPIFTTTNDKYYNTAIKKGTRYYYKARGYIEYKGVRYYSGWSAKAWRMVK